MYELTTSEAATILAVLARDPELQSSDLGRLGIPPSTFYAVRRKIYEAGWLSDRYLPHPWAYGVEAVDFVLASPPPSERSRIETEWGRSSANVLLWAGLNVLFGVFFRRPGAPPPSAEGARVTITPSDGSIPVYFDYSQSWSRFIRAGGGTGYPRGSGGAPPRAGHARGSAMSQLLGEDAGAIHAHPAGNGWHSPSGLTRPQRLLLERGEVQSRTFLDVGALPPYQGRVLGEIVFLTGKLREGASATEVLGRLNNDCQVSPVLMAADGASVMLCALGQVGVGTPHRTKIPRAAQHVADALDSSLRDLRMTIEPTGSVRTVIDHRYDRLIGAPGAGPSEGARSPP